jgi:hypothetical protein
MFFPGVSAVSISRYSGNKGPKGSFGSNRLAAAFREFFSENKYWH